MEKTWVRLISFLMAFGLSIAILVFPQPLIGNEGHAHHGLLMLLMVGVGVGFVHGVGFRPSNKIVYYFFSPIIAWPIMLGGIWLMAVNSGLF